MKYYALLCLISVTSLQIGCSSSMSGIIQIHDSRYVKEQIEELKATEYGKEFLVQYSEEDLEIAMLFLRDPLNLFERTRNIQHLWPYFWVYQKFLRDTYGLETDIWGPFLEEHFHRIDERRLRILTFLFINAPPGSAKELFADVYIKQFNCFPAVYVRYLKKRKNWKGLVDELSASDSSWATGLKKLGNTAFEKEFKEYVSSRKRSL